jgi:hypothetical protein
MVNSALLSLDTTKNDLPGMQPVSCVAIGPSAKAVAPQMTGASVAIPLAEWLSRGWRIVAMTPVMKEGTTCNVLVAVEQGNP